MEDEDLESEAALFLGSLEEASYEEYYEKMLSVAKEVGIRRPKLALDLKFCSSKNTFVKEIVYEIHESEWSVILKDISAFASIPRVYVIDSDLLSLPMTKSCV